MSIHVREEEFEDTKWVIKIKEQSTQWRKGQTTIHKIIAHKTKDRKPCVNSCAPEG
jgi:hypothetical protein